MTDIYESPLCRRYASRTMQEIFSDDNKFSTWRRLWLALAESEQELGLPITDDQLDEMRAHLTDIDYDLAARKEREVRHDVMAHVLTFGECCPKARAIIHLGATSCFVGDNTDVIQMRDALLQIRALLLEVLRAGAAFAEKYRRQPTLAYTHFQAAQPTTLGKRACLWIQDFLMDLTQVERALADLKLLGCKGTTGTAASFLELFRGDGEKVKELERRIAAKMGFEHAVFPVSGQTYTRKLDYTVLSALCGVAQSAHKFTNDIRLLSHEKEFDEPFESGQIGSSAMAYKRNPMRSERVASLARFVITGSLNPALTAAEQWLERTLDDSANRRLAIPESFLATDAMLTLVANILSGGRVYPQMMERHLREELPFMATENILMYCVREKHADRQMLHEAIRRHSVAAASRVKAEGRENDLLERIAGDELFGLSRAQLEALMDVKAFTGRAADQVGEFLAEQVYPVLQANEGVCAPDADIRV